MTSQLDLLIAITENPYQSRVDFVALRAELAELRRRAEASDLRQKAFQSAGVPVRVRKVSRAK